MMRRRRHRDVLGLPQTSRTADAGVLLAPGAIAVSPHAGEALGGNRCVVCGGNSNQFGTCVPSKLVGQQIFPLVQICQDLVAIGGDVRPVTWRAGDVRQIREVGCRNRPGPGPPQCVRFIFCSWPSALQRLLLSGQTPVACDAQSLMLCLGSQTVRHRQRVSFMLTSAPRAGRRHGWRPTLA